MKFSMAKELKVEVLGVGISSFKFLIHKGKKKEKKGISTVD